jgi:hypothetical protein
MFGVDLKELNARQSFKSPIPKIVTDAISYLDCYGVPDDKLLLSCTL